MHRRRFGEHFTEGSRQAWIEIGKRGWSLATLAREAQVPQSSLHRSMYGDVETFSASLLVRLESCLGVPCAAWMRPPVEPFTPPGAVDDDPAPDSDDAPTVPIPKVEPQSNGEHR